MQCTLGVDQPARARIEYLVGAATTYCYDYGDYDCCCCRTPVVGPVILGTMEKKGNEHCRFWGSAQGKTKVLSLSVGVLLVSP